MQPNEGEAEAQQEVADLETEVEALEEATEAVQDTTDWKAKFEEADGRLRRAQTKLDKVKIEKKVEVRLQEKSGDLDETQLDYFDLKGYSDSDELEIFQKIMLKTGMTPRQVIKDDYAIAKITSLRAEKEVKSAMPSSTKRAGAGQSNDLATAIAKYEQTGQLPDSFELRSAVINAKVDRESTNKPSWHR